MLLLETLRFNLDGGKWRGRVGREVTHDGVWEEGKGSLPVVIRNKKMTLICNDYFKIYRRFRCAAPYLEGIVH